LIAVLLFVGACGSGGATGSIGARRTPEGPPVTESPGATAAVVGTLPPGALTIATLGDSLTEGTGDDSGGGGYPGRLQRLLEPLRPGTRIVNVGHSDGNHPNEAGYDRIAAIWFAALKPLL
jgi:lysophospholipase L1-like esterase